MSEQPTIFTRIINREIPADILFEDDLCFVIKDIQPQADIHLLVIPKEPIPRLVDATAEHQTLLGHLMLRVGEIATQLGVGDGFRVVINNGEGAGQTVYHLHLHVMADNAFKESNLGAH